MTNSANDVGNRVLEVTRSIVDNSRASQLQLSSALFDERWIDSFGVIQLVAALEDEFKLQLKTEDLTSQNFETPATIAALIERSQAPTA